MGVSLPINVYLSLLQKLGSGKDLIQLLGQQKYNYRKLDFKIKIYLYLFLKVKLSLLIQLMEISEEEAALV